MMNENGVNDVQEPLPAGICVQINMNSSKPNFFTEALRETFVVLSS